MKLISTKQGPVHYLSDSLEVVAKLLSPVAGGLHGQIASGNLIGSSLLESGCAHAVSTFLRTGGFDFDVDIKNKLSTLLVDAVETWDRILE